MEIMMTKEQQKTADIESFIKTHGKALLNYIYSMMKKWEVAEDIYQETLLSAFISYDSFEYRSSFKNWLFKIASNKCKDEWKKQKVQQRLIEGKQESIEQIVMQDETEKTVMEKSLQEELMKKIDELPNKYQQSLMLYYFHDYSMKDISTKTALPLSTVKTHLKRGKERLRRKVVGIY
ncbi:RNA polymerase sigma factor [Heyndrickxia sporothermodurans]|uniref:RNA polymerase sigma factor n=1 Tax=Heyndrickxia sporothermodurans TaxID=46224 RepID=A0AB37HMX6_9BACI|nr:RNA polymerase sigma factor [Heyndrickxia sporothermodurans]MBL5769006.1 RNA polymerase sigma factor [Heyndrickxia sporothermodurans]MBL5772786.1 RNA polymerase sigma factor [Heyndrickxia sporothermodurans]MBL5776256.1 RNA polymerase sigma factor [Heyndrickxia sporothermodurans]MBL5779804.1 RNA polymerase sigma factor [Heyndrickxia sporothermodurans]MBL5786881.1 RNA polymerase sigma factor [Heyndrickxia sporothermodurans]